MSLFCSHTDPYETKSANHHKDSHPHSLPDLLGTIPNSKKAMALTLRSILTSLFDCFLLKTFQNAY